jgi:hypothetical protein
MGLNEGLMAGITLFIFLQWQSLFETDFCQLTNGKKLIGPIIFIII